MMEAIKRGDLVRYVKDPRTVLKVESDPYPWNGRTVVTCREATKKPKLSTQAMYDVAALRRDDGAKL